MLQFPKSIHHLEASSIMAWREEARAAQYQLDLAGTDAFDSSLLALLLDLRRSAAADGQTLTIHHIPTKLTALATLYGVNALIA